jgi:hypothetical protein
MAEASDRRLAASLFLVAPGFHYTKLDDLKIEMLGAAEIAEKTGAKLGDPVSFGLD